MSTVPIVEMNLKMEMNNETLINGEEGDMFIVSGCHFVNRVGFFITEKPWDRKHI